MSSRIIRPRSMLWYHAQPHPINVYYQRYMMITLNFSWNFRIILMFERKHFKSQISDLILAWIYNFVKMWLFVRMLNCKFGFQDTFCFWSVYLIQIYCLFIFFDKTSYVLITIYVFTTGHRTQAIFSTLLSGGRDTGECWSRGSQILGATNMSPGRGGTFQCIFSNVSGLSRNHQVYKT